VHIHDVGRLNMVTTCEGTHSEDNSSIGRFLVNGTSTREWFPVEHISLLEFDPLYVLDLFEWVCVDPTFDRASLERIRRP
jgi:hypothetical protein